MNDKWEEIRIEPLPIDSSGDSFIEHLQWWRNQEDEFREAFLKQYPILRDLIGPVGHQ